MCCLCSRCKAEPTDRDLGWRSSLCARCRRLDLRADYRRRIKKETEVLEGMKQSLAKIESELDALPKRAKTG